MANNVSPSPQTTAIKNILADMGPTADKFIELSAHSPAQDDIKTAGEVAIAKQALFEKAMDLVREVRGPIDMIFAHAENVSQWAATRTLLDMGVFEAIPRGGEGVTTDDIAAKTGAAKELLVRCLRNASVGYGPFKEVGLQTYAHTPLSEMYLFPPMRNMFKLLADLYLPALARLNEFFKNDNYQYRLAQTHCAYNYAHNVPEGQTMWDHLIADSERNSLFNAAMVALTQASLSSIGVYPFEAELNKHNIGDDEVALIDIGGGRGHGTLEIRRLAPGLKGKVLLQDRLAVLNDIEGDLPGVEKMEYDFFTPQPIKGALAYYIRRCLHDWDDDMAKKILQAQAGAMEPGKSRLLISEMVVPDRVADSTASWFDMVMLTFTGKERTEKQWTDLLDQSGLKLVKIWSCPGTDTSTIEACLK